MASSDHQSGTILPSDVWPEILKRTPVKPLCRFRCVCKSWNSLISSPRFISDHRNSSSAPSGKFLFTYSSQTGNPSSYAILYPGETEPVDDDHLDFPAQTQLAEHGTGTSTIADVIHGVICLVYSPGSCLVSILRGSHVSAVLWNPTIHKHYPLSWPEHPEPEIRGYFVVGFGLDTATNDLKVVRLSSSRLGFSAPDCQVFSPREGRWREPAINRFSRLCQIPRATSCFTHGRIHWIAERPGSYYTLLAYDCERDEFKDMDDHLPEEVRAVRDFCKAPELFVHCNRSLAVCQNSEAGGNSVVLWVMDSYGDPSSWRPLFSFRSGALKKLNPFKGEVVLRSPFGGVFAFKESLLLMDVGKPLRA